MVLIFERSPKSDEQVLAGLLTILIFRDVIKDEVRAIMIYEHILRANKRFGTEPIDIVHSVFHCEPETIQSNVIIAPLWRPELLNDYYDGIIQDLDGLFKIWTLSMGDLKITYIVTGMGASNVNDIVLALGCTPCKKIIFIGSVGALDTHIGIGDIVIPEYSICGDGACRYLTNKKLTENDSFGEKNYPNKELFDKIVSNFDMRLKEPNKEPVIDQPALHTFEHLGATFLRSHKEWAERVVYFGPMGCRTGFYAIFEGDLNPETTLPLIKEMLEWIMAFEGAIPGASAMECGNWQEQNLEMAKWEARRYAALLGKANRENFYYPA